VTGVEFLITVPVH